MKTRSRVFYGWVVVFTSAVGLFFGAFPITVFSFGVFFLPFVNTFHATRASISLAFTVHNLISGILAVFIGRLCDRVGTRRVILLGLGLLASLLIAVKSIGSDIWQLYLFYAALGVVAPATTSVPYSLVVSRWFNRRRGLALGLMMLGLGTGAIVVPGLAQRFIVAFGWRNTFAAFGALVLLVPVPVIASLLKESPSEIGLLPDGSPTSTDSTVADWRTEGLAWKEISRSQTFWLMVVCFCMVAASVHACMIHLPQLLADAGAGSATTALATSLLGAAVLIGRTVCGYFLDKYFAPRVAQVVFLHAAAGLVLVALGQAAPITLLGAFLVGLAFGAEVDIIAYLIGRYFGLRSFGVAFGFAFGAFVVAGGAGPLLMGYGFDRTGSYRLVLFGFAVATFASVALLRLLGPYRYAPPRPREKAPAALRRI